MHPQKRSFQIRAKTQICKLSQKFYFLNHLYSYLSFQLLSLNKMILIQKMDEAFLLNIWAPELKLNVFKLPLEIRLHTVSHCTQHNTLLKSAHLTLIQRSNSPIFFLLSVFINSGLPKAEVLRPKSKVSNLRLHLPLSKVYAAEGRRSNQRLKHLKFSKFKCKFCDKNFRMIKVHVCSVLKKV